MIDITNACNLRCRYCYHFHSPGDVRKDISLEEWTRFFEELRSLSVLDVCIAGGEPFIRKDITDILDAVVKNRMRYSLVSNGSLITADHAVAISSTKRCNGVQISIDGATASTHDQFRGEGSFEAAMRGIHILNDHGVIVTSRVTVTPANIEELPAIADLLLNKSGMRSISTNSVSAQGCGEENAGSVRLNAEQLSQAMVVLTGLERTYPGRISAAAGPLAEARMFADMEFARKQNLSCLDNRGFLVGCGCPWSKIGVRADGVIVPCNMLSHMELGRINEDSLADIWQNHPELNRLRQRREIPLSSFEFCLECPWMMYCTGNCPASGYTMTGSVYHPSPEGCIRRFVDQGGKIPGF